ncbi:MAG: alpha-L-fucosidase [Lachnospiraceae bacterium]
MDKIQYLSEIEQVIKKGPYQDSWDSLCRYSVPRWYSDAKFGIFVHWGIYSVPAFGNEWYPRHMYQRNSKEYLHHVSTYGELNKFGYKDFIPMFQAENFSAERWMDHFKNAGAKFIMPVGEHHDGFQMYESDFSNWNAKQMGPKRDVLSELRNAAESRGLMFCTSSHRAEHWWFFNHGRSEPDSDVCMKEYQSFYGPAAGVTRNQDSLYDNQPDRAFLEDWLVRTCEIVDKYRPKMLYFDWWIQVSAFKPYLKKFAAYYYNRGAEWGIVPVIATKFDAFVYGSALQDVERGKLGEISPICWQSDTSSARNSWCHTWENQYKDAVEIIWDLIDVISKNGVLALNIGPKADGTITVEEQIMLTEIGDWLRTNEEAVYGTTAWKTYGEGSFRMGTGHFQDRQVPVFTGEDIRFTAKADSIFAFVMRWPEDGVVRIHSLGKNSELLNSSIRSISILGFHYSPLYEFRGDWLEITADLRNVSKPIVLKIVID